MCSSLPRLHTSHKLPGLCAVLGRHWQYGETHSHDYGYGANAMIYGLNFGRPDIPTDLRFKRRIRVDGRYYMLVGACQSLSELEYMRVVATNGTRQLHTETRNGWTAVYAY